MCVTTIDYLAEHGNLNGALDDIVTTGFSEELFILLVHTSVQRNKKSKVYFGYFTTDLFLKSPFVIKKRLYTASRYCFPQLEFQIFTKYFVYIYNFIIINKLVLKYRI